MSTDEVVYQWLDTYYDYLAFLRAVERSHLQKLAHYFASYLVSSFILEEKQRYTSYSRCGCELCSRLVLGSRLKVKKTNREDKSIAEVKKRDSILRLATRKGLKLSSVMVEELISDSALSREINYLAYMQSIFDRMEGKQLGSYVLSLWRGIAWKPSGSPIRNFALELEDVLVAEKTVLESIKMIIKAHRF